MLIVTVFVTAITLMGCQVSSISISTETPEIISTALSTNTSSPSATAISIPRITATPVSAKINTSEDFYLLLKQLYQFPCIGMNYANSSSLQAPSKLEFIEVDVQPDPKTYWVSEIADNIDKSRQAFVACEPDSCQDKIYVKDIQTQMVHEISWGWQTPWRPIQWVTWINNDSLAFFQSANPEQGQIIVVDVVRREYLYAAIVFPDYFCTTPTPTP